MLSSARYEPPVRQLFNKRSAWDVAALNDQSNDSIVAFVGTWPTDPSRSNASLGRTRGKQEPLSSLAMKYILFCVAVANDAVEFLFMSRFFASANACKMTVVASSEIAHAVGRGLLVCLGWGFLFAGWVFLLLSLVSLFAGLIGCFVSREVA